MGPGHALEVPDFKAGLPKWALFRRRQAGNVEMRSHILGSIDTEKLVNRIGVKKTSKLLSTIGPDLYIFNNSIGPEGIAAIEENIGLKGFSKITKAVGAETFSHSLAALSNDQANQISSAVRVLYAAIQKGELPAHTEGIWEWIQILKKRMDKSPAKK